MDVLKGITFTVTCVVLGSLLVFIAAGGAIRVAGAQAAVTAEWSRIAIGCLGIVLVVTSITLEVIKLWNHRDGPTGNYIATQHGQPVHDTTPTTTADVFQPEVPHNRPLLAESDLHGLPPPVAEYLRHFPEFAVPHEIGAQYVRTSRESFMAAVRCLHRSLQPGERVISTDSLRFHRDAIFYWVRDGIAYLRINHEAVVRDVSITRIFVVARSDLDRYRETVRALCRLHALAGVTAQVATYESLPSNCRYEFAMFGGRFVDEVVFDMSSRSVIDNSVHWSTHKLAAFQERAGLIANYTDGNWTQLGRPVGDFSSVCDFAREVRDVIDADMPP